MQPSCVTHCLGSNVKTVVSIWCVFPSCCRTCAAELFVWEDDVARTIKFTNARSDGFMSKFDGTWHVQPFTQQTLDSIYKGPTATAPSQQQHKGQNWLGSELQGGE